MTESREPERPRRGTVVVIDDDEAARVSIGQMLRLRGYTPALFAAAAAALAWPGLRAADGIITDVKMPGMDGEQFLAEAGRRRLAVPVIMITGHGDVTMAVRCLKAGAYDFVEKPFDEDVLLASVARAAETAALRRESEQLRARLASLAPQEEGRFGMVGRSRAMLDIYNQIEVVAGVDSAVLIWGETGVGKELVARAIHAHSARARGPFVPVNAGALPESMLESDLFGHARGAYTGAQTDRDGKLVTASGGTLLLDEVESLSPRAQVDLLRVLEDGLVYPLGRDAPVRVDIRLLATSKTAPEELLRQGAMRDDFFHRISVFTLNVPPLRARAEDIPLLASHFLRQVATREGIPVPQIPDDTLAAMMRYAWPGNVRELGHVVERLLIMAVDGVLGPFRGDAADQPRLLSLPAAPSSLRDAMEHVERAAIEGALRDSRGRILAACRALGISRRGLYDRMKRYGLRKEDYRK